MKLFEKNIHPKTTLSKTSEVLRAAETPEDDVPFDSERDILDTDWQGMKVKLEEYRQNNNWWHFSSQAMEMKLLKPERSDELNINDTDWQGMKDLLEEYRQNNHWGDFSSQAMNMRLLAAEKVEITPDGQIKITPKPKPLKTVEPLPQRGA